MMNNKSTLFILAILAWFSLTSSAIADSSIDQKPSIQDASSAILAIESSWEKQNKTADDIDAKFHALNDDIKKVVQLLPHTKADLQNLTAESFISGQWQREKHVFYKSWKAYANLQNIRGDLLELFPEHEKRLLKGFGSDAIRQTLLEVEWLAVDVQLMLYHSSIKVRELALGFTISPVPAMVSIAYLLFVLFVLKFWQNKIMPMIQAWMLDQKKRYYMMFLRFYAAVGKPIEYGLAGFFILKEIAQLLQLESNNFFIQILTLVIALMVIFAANKRLFAKAESRLKRIQALTIILLLVYAVPYYVLMNGLDGVNLGHSVLAYWLDSAAKVLLVIVTFLVLHTWRGWVFDQLHSESFSYSKLAQYPEHFYQGWRSYLFVIPSAIYVFAVYFIRALIDKVSGNESVDLWLTYFFRIEVLRQHAKNEHKVKTRSLPDEFCEVFNHQQAVDKALYLEGIAKDLRDKIIDITQLKKSSICLLHSPKGGGKTTFLKSLKEHQLLKEKNFQYCYVDCPRGDFNLWVEHLTASLAFDDSIEADEEVGNARGLMNTLKDMGDTIICVDNVHKLIVPCIGGLQEFERLMRLMRKSSPNITWLLSIDTAAWRFVERARGERFIFDIEQNLPKWSAQAIAELVDDRNKRSALQLDLQCLDLPHRISSSDNEDESMINRYCRVLWEYASGNPGVALQLWRDSLYQECDAEGNLVNPDNTLVRLFDVGENKELVKLGNSALLVLRAVMQMGDALKDDIAKSVNLTGDEVIDTLRYLRSRGFIVRDEAGEYQIVWAHYRRVSTLLERKHLLALWE